MTKASKDFSQVVVWENTIVGKKNVEKFVTVMKQHMDVRVRFIEEFIREDGSNDVIFFIHSEDIRKFAVKRFQLGHVRWLEDVINNGRQLPARLEKLRIW